MHGDGYNYMDIQVTKGKPVNLSAPVIFPIMHADLGKILREIEHAEDEARRDLASPSVRGWAQRLKWS